MYLSIENNSFENSSLTFEILMIFQIQINDELSIFSL